MSELERALHELCRALGGKTSHQGSPTYHFGVFVGNYHAIHISPTRVWFYSMSKDRGFLGNQVLSPPEALLFLRALQDERDRSGTA